MTQVLQFPKYSTVESTSVIRNSKNAVMCYSVIITAVSLCELIKANKRNTAPRRESQPCLGSSLTRRGPRASRPRPQDAAACRRRSGFLARWPGRPQKGALQRSRHTFCLGIAPATAVKFPGHQLYCTFCWWWRNGRGQEGDKRECVHLKCDRAFLPHTP